MQEGFLIRPVSCRFDPEDGHAHGHIVAAKAEHEDIALHTARHQPGLLLVHGRGGAVLMRTVSTVVEQGRPSGGFNLRAMFHTNIDLARPAATVSTLICTGSKRRSNSQCTGMAVCNIGRSAAANASMPR